MLPLLDCQSHAKITPWQWQGKFYSIVELLPLKASSSQKRNQPNSFVYIYLRFARDCINKMAEVTAELETKLGPGTVDLALRVGLNR